jgi:alpha-glucosidase (family GH31 glycosyl hydrolase)
MIYSSGAYAGIAQYSATWAGDTGGRHKVLVSMLNHALSGHSNTSCDMDIFSAEGIHFGFWQAWSQINSYAYWTQPWFLDEELRAVFRFYAELRYRLLPYIYSMSYKAHRTGLPLMRPMALAFPDEKRSDDLLYQYCFGDAFLTGAFTESLYLPKGRWIDYWTGKEYEGPTELPVDPPAGKGGAIFVRAGAIIPYWPVMQYVGQKSVETLELHVYPGPESSFELFEDDGTTLGYQQGRCAVTAVTQRTDDKTLTLQIPPRNGEYNGMPEKRSYDVVIHQADNPRAVTRNDKPVEWTHRQGLLQIHVEEDPSRRETQRLVVAL